MEASPKGYQEVGTFKIPQHAGASWAHPVIIGGKLYLREQDTVWCYDVKAKVKQPQQRRGAICCYCLSSGIALYRRYLNRRQNPPRGVAEPATT